MWTALEVWATALISLGGFVTSVVSFYLLMRDIWLRQGPAAAKRILWALAAYIASCAFMILLIAVIIEGKRCPDDVALAAVTAVFAWIFLSVIWLLRTLAPELPRFIGRSIGPLDCMLFGVLAVALVLVVAWRTGCT